MFVVKNVDACTNASHAAQRFEIEGLTRLVKAAAFKDDDTGLHIVRVAFYALEIARLVDYPDSELLGLFFAAAVHDIGKIAIPDEILKKKEKLAPSERAIIEKHSQAGAIIFSNFNSDISQTCCSVAMNHHEDFDGGGYPQGLKGHEIPLTARIVAIADVYDALTTDRCYRRGLSQEKAIQLMTTEMARKFDPFILDIFTRHQDHFIFLRQLINNVGAIDDLFTLYG